MSIEAVRAAIAAAREIDPAAGLALRLAAVAGLRRAELAALRWEDLEGHQLTVDKAVELVPTAQPGQPELRLAATKTANRRRIGLDRQTVAELEALRAEREGVSPFLFSLDAGPPSPAASAGGGPGPAGRPGSTRSGASTTSGTGRPPPPSAADMTSAPSRGRLGHANPAMTMRVYAHVVEGADEAVASTLGQALDGDPA